MDLVVNLLFIFLLVLTLLGTGHTRALPNKTIQIFTPIIEEKPNATDLRMPLENVEVAPATTSIKHRRRSKREMPVAMPFDLHTLHLPCDWDHRGINFVITHLPNHCIWVYNNRFSHVGFYRIFKTYQLEGFFFGQYYERLSRYETDSHEFGFD